jgi:lipoprotein-anchoring transpeptidase ErfK/SrfK
VALARATARARYQTTQTLAAADYLIASAQSFDIDAAAAHQVVAEQRQQVQSATTLRQFRVISAALRAPTTALQAAVASRKTEVTHILAQAGNSQAGVIQLADADVQSVQSRLSLLGLLTSRATTYSARLAALDHEVHVAQTETSSAVKELELHQEVAAAASDYARTIPDKMIVVSTEQQSATMYEKGNVVFNTPVTTGGPELPTDHGIFHIYLKLSPFVFHSPWPPGSPYYYPPTPVQYWMPFDGAEGLHDASWRSDFGPGSNFAPTDLGTGNYILGTHGCVNLPFNAAQFVWDWAPVGTTVVVV